jgi:prepilin-type N-terminal cleavage/methylation domain-containing protein
MRRRGFTLIEILLATSLTAIVGLAVASVLGTQLTARKRMHQRSDRRTLLSALERRIRADLKAVVPPGGLYASGITGEDQVSESGEELLPPELAPLAAQATTASGDPAPFDQRDTLTLAVWPSAHAFGEDLPLGEGSLWEVRYEIDDDPETEERGLIRRIQRVRDLAVGTDPPAPEQIASEVVGMDVQYFDGQEWQETWDSGASDTLPTAIALQLLVAHQGDVFVYRIHVSALTGRPSQLPEAGR